MVGTSHGTLFLKPTQLIIILPDGTEQVVPLIKDSTRIGRGDVNNDVALPLDLKFISRQLVEVRREGADFRILDLSSKNEMLVNGINCEDALLKDGDEIRIGPENQQLRIMYQMGSGSMLQQMALRPESTVMNLPAALPQGGPALAVRLPSGQTRYLAVQKENVIIGRSPDADLTVPIPFVSAHHAELKKVGRDFTICDLNSTNGTLLNNRPLSAGIPAPIHHNDIIRIGDDRFGTSLSITLINPFEPAPPQEGFSMVVPTVMVPSAQTITIGRAPDCQIRLENPTVSRRHAVISMQGPTAVLTDMGSSNGTYVNDQLVHQVELKEGDIIRVGDFLLLYDDGKVTSYQSTGMRLDVAGLSKDVSTRKGKLRILDNINLSILPREFIALVGGSGAGKSTLLNALVGIRPGQGQVNLNGHDFYTEYEQYRSQLGYVPQNDILHTSLTVEKALDYAARLRLPASVGAEERSQRITAVLETVSMNTETIRRTRIGNLSGGQRKRVSIAAELLADPKLIYLDEATSGLDPGLEKKMMHTLRRMADEGRTVVLITHATDNIIQTDHVAFLSQGRLIFFGPSQEALDFFEVGEFADIYEKIERSGEQWRTTFQETNPTAYQKYVLGRQASARAVPKQELPKARFGLGAYIRQFMVLTQRSLSVLFSDPVTLLLMLLLLPLTGTLQLVIGSKEILTGNLAILADPAAAAKTMLENYVPFAKTNTFVFVMGLEAVLTGLFVPSNDLVKERSIYLRERMVNLKVLPYLFSKAAIYSAFVIIQVALYLLVLSLGVDFPRDGLYLPGVIELFVTLFLTMMAGITFGFIISAVSRSTEMAIYLLTMLLFFQFFFAGTVFDLRGNTFEPLSYFSTTRWALTALGITVDMPKIVESTILCSEVPQNPLNPAGGTKTVCANYPEASEDLMLDYSEKMLVRSWLVLIGMSLLFLTITGILLEKTNSG